MYRVGRHAGGRACSRRGSRLARRRANAVRRLAPAFVSPQAFRAPTLAASGYGGARQLRRECRLGRSRSASPSSDAGEPWPSQAVAGLDPDASFWAIATVTPRLLDRRFRASTTSSAWARSHPTVGSILDQRLPLRQGKRSCHRRRRRRYCNSSWLSEKAEVVGRITSGPANSRTEMGRRPRNGRIRHVRLPLARPKPASHPGQLSGCDRG